MTKRDPWIREVMRVANDPGTEPEIRARLRAVIRREGDTPVLPVPSETVALRRGRVILRPDLPPKPITVSGQFAWDYARQLMAIALSPRGERLRCCAYCERVWEAKGAFARTRFCSEDHRRAWDKEHRDPKKQRDYMRKYRAQLKSRRRKR